MHIIELSRSTSQTLLSVVLARMLSGTVWLSWPELPALTHRRRYREKRSQTLAARRACTIKSGVHLCGETAMAIPFLFRPAVTVTAQAVPESRIQTLRRRPFSWSTTCDAMLHKCVVQNRLTNLLVPSNLSNCKFTTGQYQYSGIDPFVTDPSAIILQVFLKVTVFVSCLVLWNFFQKSNFRPLLGNAGRTTNFAPVKSLRFFELFLELSPFEFRFTVFFPLGCGVDS